MVTQPALSRRARSQIQTRKRILLAAIRIFGEKGIERATVDEIAAQGRRMFLVLDGNSERGAFAQRFDARALTGVDMEFVDRYHNVSLATIGPSHR